MFEKNKVGRVGDRRRRRGFRNVILIVRDEDSVFGEGALRWLVGWLGLGIAVIAITIIITTTALNAERYWWGLHV
jgi:hypothetical protein